MAQASCVDAQLVGLPCGCAVHHHLLPRLLSPLPSSPRSLSDNTYKGTFGSDGWGFQANEKLSKVRGKDFRHEKTKAKKNGKAFHRGGTIDMHTVRSVKLD